jgi:cobalt/nickel transport system permease protein
MKNTILELYALEQLSSGDTCIHRLHPLVKLLVSTVFIITVVSFNRYDLAQLVPYIFYPILLTALCETLYAMLVKRFFIALPFCLFAGISNVLFDTTAAFTINGITVSYGFISLIT